MWMFSLKQRNLDSFSHSLHLIHQHILSAFPSKHSKTWPPCITSTVPRGTSFHHFSRGWLQYPPNLCPFVNLRWSYSFVQNFPVDFLPTLSNSQSLYNVLKDLHDLPRAHLHLSHFISYQPPTRWLHSNLGDLLAPLFPEMFFMQVSIWLTPLFPSGLW